MMAAVPHRLQNVRRKTVRCKLARISDGLRITYIGPYHHHPSGWAVVTRVIYTREVRA